jgi:hypothetical protein
MAEKRKGWVTTNCGHRVEITIYIGSDGSEEFDVPSACDECERLAEEESERYAAEGERRAHLHGAWG